MAARGMDRRQQDYRNSGEQSSAKFSQVVDPNRLPPAFFRNDQTAGPRHGPKPRSGALTAQQQDPCPSPKLWQGAFRGRALDNQPSCGFEDVAAGHGRSYSR